MPRSSGQARSAGHQCPGLSLELTEAVPQDMQWLGGWPFLLAVLIALSGAHVRSRSLCRQWWAGGIVGPLCRRVSVHGPNTCAKMTLPVIGVQRCSHCKTEPATTKTQSRKAQREGEVHSVRQPLSRRHLPSQLVGSPSRCGIESRAGAQSAFALRQLKSAAPRAFSGVCRLASCKEHKGCEGKFLSEACAAMPLCFHMLCVVLSTKNSDCLWSCSD